MKTITLQFAIQETAVKELYRLFNFLQNELGSIVEMEQVVFAEKNKARVFNVRKNRKHFSNLVNKVSEELEHGT